MDHDQVNTNTTAHKTDVSLFKTFIQENIQQNKTSIRQTVKPHTKKKTKQETKKKCFVKQQRTQWKRNMFFNIPM